VDNSVSSHACIVTLHTYPHLYGYKYNNRYLLHIGYIKYSNCLHISLSCDILPRWSLPIGLSYIKHRIPGGAMLYRVLCITKAHHNYWNSHDVLSLFLRPCPISLYHTCITFQPLNSDKIRPVYPLKNDNAIIWPITASYSHCFTSCVHFYTQYI
jgi:hypothetical protein